MKLSPDVQQVIQEYANKYPLPASNETASQDWAHKLAQQLKFSFPAAGWGHKFAGPGRPHSKDVVCVLSPFIGWDIVLGAGTPNPVLSLNGDSIDLTGQLFEQVDAYDWLSNGGVIPIPPTDDTLKKLDQILTNLDIMTKWMAINMETLNTEIKLNHEGEMMQFQALLNKPTEVTHPEYTGKLALNMTFSPKK